MRFSLISATSIFALLSAAVGPVHAGVVTVTPAQTNIYDFVHDGMTSADGGDQTVSREEPSVLAIKALETANVSRQRQSFTGPVDPVSQTSAAVPRVPLGAAPGTHPDDDFATPISGAWNWDRSQKALATGIALIAPLIGTVGNGQAQASGAKPGTTVFVEAGSSPSFNDSSNFASAVRRSSVAVAYAPSSTSTATITVAGAGNFRGPAGSGFSVAAANSLQTMKTTAEAPPRGVDMTDAAQPTLGFHYAPAASAAKGNAIEASFSDAVTATGQFAQLRMPARVQTSELRAGRIGGASNGAVQTSQLARGGIQTSEVASGQGQALRTQTSEIASETISRLIDLSQPVGGDGDTHGDGTRTFISASVSANPTVTATRYLANVVDTATVAQAGRTVEAFQIGPTRTGSGTTVADPLHGKIMASAGPLNNSLALP